MRLQCAPRNAMSRWLKVKTPLLAFAILVIYFLFPRDRFGPAIKVPTYIPQRPTLDPENTQPFIPVEDIYKDLPANVTNPDCTLQEQWEAEYGYLGE